MSGPDRDGRRGSCDRRSLIGSVFWWRRRWRFIGRGHLAGWRNRRGGSVARRWSFVWRYRNGGRERHDGTGPETLQGLERAHHDFTVLPDGGAVFLVIEDGGEETEVTEYSPTGTLSVLVRLNEEVYGIPSSNYHANAIRYWAKDDSLTVSDLGISSVTKFDRQGNLQWRAGGLPGTHGHHLLESGNLLSFMTGSETGQDEIAEYSGVGGTLTEVWSFTGGYRSFSFGDAQRLANGNTLITFSNARRLQEVTPANDLARSVELEGGMGYSMFPGNPLWPPPVIQPPPGPA